MQRSLLEQFVSEECTPYVRSLLEQALGDPNSPSEFNFNRFDVIIDREMGLVRLEDVLDASDAGADSIPVPRFLVAIASRTAS